jgi:hypothetical protein
VRNRISGAWSALWLAPAGTAYEDVLICLIDKVLAAAAEDDDMVVALRKVVLLQGFLAESQASPALRHCCEAVLTKFPPVAGNFENGAYPLLGKERVTLVRTAQGTPSLRIRVGFFEELCRECFGREADGDESHEL